MKLNIKDRIDKLGISKNKLAQQLKISYPTMLDMYNGESTSIKLETLEKLCDILNCTPNDIFVSESTKNKSSQDRKSIVLHLSDFHIAKDKKENTNDYLQRLLETLKVEISNDGNGKKRGYIFLDGFDKYYNSLNLKNLPEQKPSLPTKQDEDVNKSDTE